jgi:hypothetical protein
LGALDVKVQAACGFEFEALSIFVETYLDTGCNVGKMRCHLFLILVYSLWFIQIRVSEYNNVKSQLSQINRKATGR